MHRALITGGAAGIGAAFAKALAARGFALVLIARNPVRLEAFADRLRAEHGVEVETMVADLSDRDAQQRVADRLESDAAPIDMLVNNAGFSVRSKLLAEDTSQHDLGIEVMIRAVLKLGGAAGRAMSRRGKGWIINVGSVSGLVTQNNYSAIKAWVNNYSQSLGVQLAGTGVHVTTLMPGWVRTEFHSRAGIKGSSIPAPLWIDADTLVEQCLRDTAKGRAISVPTRRWRLIAWGLRRIPYGQVAGLSALLTSRRDKER